ncbi:hypothetical protein V6N13_102463 [Hibiscus sabdariffa]
MTGGHLANQKTPQPDKGKASTRVEIVHEKDHVHFDSPLAPPTTIGKPDAKKRVDRNWDNLMTDEYEDGNPAPTPHPLLASFVGPKRVKHWDTSLLLLEVVNPFPISPLGMAKSRTEPCKIINNGGNRPSSIAFEQASHWRETSWVLVSEFHEEERSYMRTGAPCIVAKDDLPAAWHQFRNSNENGLWGGTQAVSLANHTGSCLSCWTLSSSSLCHSTTGLD